jgi:hypothetical protein
MRPANRSMIAPRETHRLTHSAVFWKDPRG